MDIVKLRSFAALAQHSSFSKAARALHITQSTVSLHIQALEQELQVRLVERLPRRSVLTADGQLLLPSAEELLNGHDRAVAAFAERRHSGAGRVRVAATNSIMMYYLPARLQQFVARWPAVEVSVLPARREHMMAMVSQRECDFAIAAAGPMNATLRFHEVLRTDILLITSTMHPLAALARRKVTLEDVARHPLVVYPKDSAIRQMVDSAFEARGLAMQITLETGGAEMIKRYVEVGLGVGFVSRLSLRPEDEARIYTINLRRYLPQRRYGVLLPRVELSRPARRLLRLIAPGLSQT